jgi:hypothetical protein
MRIALVACAAVLSAVTLHASQDQKKKSHKPTIVVTGCLDGTWLRVQQSDAIGGYVERYKLRAAKQVLKEMGAKYHRHLIEVTGTVTDTGDSTHMGSTIAVGKKTTITTGAKDVPTSPSGTDDPLLEVESFRDLKDRCK